VEILHVYKDYYPVLGGIENHVRVLAEAQARQGHAVTVLVTNRGRRSVTEHLNGVRVIKVGRLGTVASTPLSPGLAGALRGLRPALTHLHAPYPVGELAQWVAGRGRPYVITYHADPTRLVQRAALRLYGPLFKHILRGAARVLATSPNYAATSPYLRAAASRVAVVPLGVDAERFQPGPPLSEQPPTLLFVGQLRHYKGLDDLLRALREVPEARLVVAGEGPLRAEWEALSASLGLAERVTFRGRVAEAELPGLYQQASLFVLPANTRAEAFGTVLLEAMAAGLPCVTTEVGSGTAYVVQDGVTGLVVAPRSPAALAQALRGLLADPARRARLGAAGRARVLAEFTQARMLERVETIYTSVIQSPRL
jgi:rhamnosyl/mannosyltransferase